MQLDTLWSSRVLRATYDHFELDHKNFMSGRINRQMWAINNFHKSCSVLRELDKYAHIVDVLNNLDCGGAALDTIELVPDPTSRRTTLPPRIPTSQYQIDTASDCSLIFCAIYGVRTFAPRSARRTTKKTLPETHISTQQRHCFVYQVKYETRFTYTSIVSLDSFTLPATFPARGYSNAEDMIRRLTATGATRILTTISPSHRHVAE